MTAPHAERTTTAEKWVSAPGSAELGAGTHFSAVVAVGQRTWRPRVMNTLFGSSV